MKNNQYSTSNNKNKDSFNSFFNFKIDDFDGPMDLLVQLIKEKKMDILTLDIAELTTQYLKFINDNLKSIEINEASEYLVMASYLTELKSKVIIPILGSSLIPEETELEIDRLRKQLFLYKQYKEIVNEFRARQYERVKLVSKNCDDMDEYIPDYIPEAPLPENVSVDKLVRAWQKILMKRIDRNDSPFIISVSKVDVDEIQKNLLEFIKTHNFTEISFEDYLKTIDKELLNLEYMCAVFVSFLVLVKDGYIILKQDKFFGKIIILRNNDIYKEINHEDI